MTGNEVLHGGMANAGAVVRDGAFVLRPAGGEAKFDRQLGWFRENRARFLEALASH